LSDVNRRSMLLRRAIVIGPAMLALLIALGLLTVAWQIVSYGEQSFNAPVDAAVVLGAAAWGNRPSPVYRERINEAIARYQNKQVKYLVFTGGTPGAGYPSEGEVGREYAIKHGVPPDAILAETTSRTTWQNLVNAKKLLDPLGIRTVLLVSDPLHLRRATAMANDLGLQALPGPTSSSRFESLTTRANFLWREIWLYLDYLVFKKPS
jgi:uncharacterized SAM-binding protein YcdF (DUF218 family)